MGPSGGEGAVGASLGPFALVRRSAGQGHGRFLPVTLPRYAATLEAAPIDSLPVAGSPWSAHSGRNRGGRTIQPDLRSGRAMARNLRNQLAATPPFPYFEHQSCCHVPSANGTRRQFP